MEGSDGKTMGQLEEIEASREMIDSSDSDSDLELCAEAGSKIEQVLIQALQTNPTDVETYMRLGQLYKMQGEKVKLDEVRRDATKFCLLPDEVWEDWILDERDFEAKYAQPGEQSELLPEFFRSALTTTPSVKLWEMFLEYFADILKKQMGADKEGKGREGNEEDSETEMKRLLLHNREFLKHMRNAYEEALASLSLHPQSGPELWRVYRSRLEGAVLEATLEALRKEFGDLIDLPMETGGGEHQHQQGGGGLPREHPLVKAAVKQAGVVRKAFMRQLRLPLTGMGDLECEWRLWLEELPPFLQEQMAGAAEEAKREQAEGEKEWERRRELEKAVESENFESLEAAVKQAGVVRKAFMRQLRLPLTGMGDLECEWRLWLEELPPFLQEQMAGAAEEAKREQAEGEKEWERRRELEKAVESENFESLEVLSNAWKKYLDFECRLKDPARVFQLYNRATRDLPSSEELWVEFAAFCWDTVKDPRAAVSVLERAVRALPDSIGLWIRLALATADAMVAAVSSSSSSGGRQQNGGSASAAAAAAGAGGFSREAAEGQAAWGASAILREPLAEDAGVFRDILERAVRCNAKLMLSAEVKHTGLGEALAGPGLLVELFCACAEGQRRVIVAGFPRGASDEDGNEGTASDEGPAEGAVRELLRLAEGSLEGREAPRLLSFWLRQEAFVFKDAKRTREVAEKLVKSAPHEPRVWDLATTALTSMVAHSGPQSGHVSVQMGEGSGGIRETASRIFAQGVKALMEHGAELQGKWVAFERDLGTVASLRTAVDRVARVREDIRKREDRALALQQGIKVPLKKRPRDAVTTAGGFTVEGGDKDGGKGKVRVTGDGGEGHGMSGVGVEHGGMEGEAEGSTQRSRLDAAALAHAHSVHAKNVHPQHLSSSQSSSKSVGGTSPASSASSEMQQTMPPPEKRAKVLAHKPSEKDISQAAQETWEGTECAEPSVAPALPIQNAREAERISRSRSRSRSPALQPAEAAPMFPPFRPPRRQSLLHPSGSGSPLPPASPESGSLTHNNRLERESVCLASAGSRLTVRSPPADAGDFWGDGASDSGRGPGPSEAASARMILPPLMEEETEETEGETEGDVEMEDAGARGGQGAKAGGKGKGKVPDVPEKKEPAHGKHYLQKQEGLAAATLPGADVTDADIKQLWIAGLDITVDEATLIDWLGAAKGLQEVRIPRDFRKKSKGFAYADFETHEDARACALKMHGKKLNDRIIRVELSRPTKAVFEHGTVFAKGIPPGAPHGEWVSALREFFRDGLKEVRVMADDRGNCKGHAYLDFDNPERVQEIVDLKQIRIRGCTLAVSKSIPMKDHRWQTANPNKVLKRNEEEAKREALPVEARKVLFVKNLNFKTTEDKIKKHFEQSGKVERVVLVRTPEGRPKGLAYVEMESPEAAMAAQILNGTPLDGHHVDVSQSNRPITERKERPAGGGEGRQQWQAEGERGGGRGIEQFAPPPRRPGLGYRGGHAGGVPRGGHGIGGDGGRGRGRRGVGLEGASSVSAQDAKDVSPSPGEKEKENAQGRAEPEASKGGEKEGQPETKGKKEEKEKPKTNADFRRLFLGL
uniref:RRM domain-containing protein n=1 Tax=Chromera velia CCMP2878 TaxID=1169474 RepID=A0A0G4G726_9ALVE|eukprot:Cvel_20524.t1-p1 / transcript=Cvel_20524.t1 / gene=Cvel_20524 / organism=Chromera_velia_CCMP2878 / gene_product=Polyadenylate-binding protein, cytoplasmic and, putative / transcript_product=Polyadenylate-binding protein, cytoplasmic and, putative / location=Cvel_scaffold1849:7945-21789(+) / protein_length=1575 / sequence_SO=supercontig / SO=protein_coding / is_pseudo=false